MKASTIFATCLVAAGSAYAQNAAAVLSAVNTISNYTQLLQSDVFNYNTSIQGLPWALAVQQDSVLLYRTVNQGQKAASSSAAFSASDSQNVYNAFANVSSLVTNALSTTQGKAATFADLGPLVRVSLYQLKKATDLFANATIAKLQSSQQSQGRSLKSGVDTAFNNAIVAYGGKGKF